MAQMNLTRKVLEQCDTRDRFRALFSQIYNYPKFGAPYQRGRPGGIIRYVHLPPETNLSRLNLGTVVVPR